MTMTDRRRGAILTVFAIGFALMAISNFSKPLSGGRGGFVLLGTRLTGVPNMIFGPLFGAILGVYAYGIWTMRRFALPIAYFYAAYVILNLILYSVKHASGERPPLLGALVYISIAVGFSSGAALILTRRKADLA
jgi:hypothetical protein